MEATAKIALISGGPSLAAEIDYIFGGPNKPQKY
jgi:hypothetical protein